MTTSLRTSPDRHARSGDASATTGRARRWGHGRERASQVLLPMVGICAAIATWWFVTWFFEIRTYYLPTPAEVVESLVFNAEHLLAASWVTIYETSIGFAIGASAGLFIATALTISPILERAMLPLVIALNAIPKVALVPLLLLWLGYGHEPNVVMAALICFFPIMIAAMSGLTSTPTELGELARSLSASGWQRFVKVRVPWALPQVFVGLKLGITLALIGTVVAELRPSSEGLGAVITHARQNAATPRAFAVILLLMVISITMFYTVVLSERLLLPWARETSARRN